MDVVLGVFAGVLGLAAGSFANVPIQRWPRGGTVGLPARSQCPVCETAIGARDNVPVLSWMWLRGRCRSCDARIPVRYPLVEALTAALFVTAALVWGWHPLLPAVLVLTWGLVVGAAIDLEHRIIPNRLTLRLPIALVVLVGLAGALEGDGGAVVRAGIAGILVPGVMLGLSELFRLLRGQAGIGMGDVKLAISIGLVVGYLGGWHLLVFAYASVVTAVVVALLLVLARRARLASRIPFGPYLAVGTLVAVLAGDVSTSFARRLLGF